MSAPAPSSVLDLIRGIKDETVDPTQIAAEDRQACVAHLAGEGYSVAEISQILRASERTIYRDKSEIRDANSLQRDPALAGRFAGQLVAEAETCMTRIRRAVRDRETPAAAKIAAEQACFQITTGVIDRLQSLGYLPTAARAVTADFTHHMELPDLETLGLQIERLRESHQLYGGGNGAIEGELQRLQNASRLLLTAGTEAGAGHDDPA